MTPKKKDEVFVAEPTRAPRRRNRPRSVRAVDGIAAIVGEYFASEEWPVVEADDGILETAFQGDAGVWACRVHVFEDDRRFVFVSAMTETVPDDKRAAVGEFCHRANFGLASGNFELDYDGGEVRFRTGVDADGAPLEVGHVRNAVVANVLTMDRYLPGIEQVIAGREPAEAVAEIEE